MSLDTEILSIHQKIQEAHFRHCSEYFGVNHKQFPPTVEGEEMTDLEIIKQTLQCIIDKLHSLDQYVRTPGNYRRPFGEDFDAENIGKMKAVLKDFTANKTPMQIEADEKEVIDEAAQEVMQELKNSVASVSE